MPIRGKQGALAGASDPSRPGWEARAIAAVDEREAKRAAQFTQRKRGVTRQVSVDEEFDRLLVLAAEARGISIIGYMRRAIARQIAKDLDMDWEQLLAHVPQATPHGGMPVGGTLKQTYDDGLGYGNWSN